MQQYRELVDELYQLWAKTTHAENGGWEIEEDEDSNYVDVVSVSKDEWEQIIGFTVSKPDAAFITAVHTGLPELVRLVHTALDEADRADFDKDSRECRIAELESELIEANYINSRLRNEFAEELANVAELQSEVETLKADLEGLIAG
jgi:chromosome segregation ATPase